tara:strand:+ start:66496 stop:66906 length:411 start_codon:yes stop_codon:yes gene_type:complete
LAEENQLNSIDDVIQFVQATADLTEKYRITARVNGKLRAIDTYKGAERYDLLVEFLRDFLSPAETYGVNIDIGGGIEEIPHVFSYKGQTDNYTLRFEVNYPFAGREESRSTFSLRVDLTYTVVDSDRIRLPALIGW